MRYRILAFVAAAVLAAAAPARAWCEASCLTAAAGAAAHCPSHEPANSETLISSSTGADCPVLESARATTAARIDAAATIVVTHAPVVTAPSPRLRPPVRPSSASTVFERNTPLRI